jgi:hypothetical protein
MIQNLILVALVILCILLLISIFRKPFDYIPRNPCRFKILEPHYTVSGNKKKASFMILVEKKHRYFINFPLSFKFYSEQQFKSLVKIFYTIPNYPKQKLLEKYIEYISKAKEHIVYLTDVVVGKVLIDVEIEIEEGNPIIEFRILENSTCDLTKEHKLELCFPKEDTE